MGVKVRMYKTDGSTSDLFLMFTKDLLELYCVTAPLKEVKSKWRLAIKDI